MRQPDAQTEIHTKRPTPDWMLDECNEFIDLHAKLHSHDSVVSFLHHIEETYSIKKYCNGNNGGARWFYQIYSLEFIQQLAVIIKSVLVQTKAEGPILEVMAGDGRLTEFIRTFTNIKVIATDAKTNRYNIAYPKWVMKADAVEAVERFDPAVVIMSWEPNHSMKGLEVANSGVPLIWIGNPDRCGHPDLFEKKHQRINSEFCISRHDNISERKFATDMFLFNCDLNGFVSAP